MVLCSQQYDNEINTVFTQFGSNFSSPSQTTESSFYSAFLRPVNMLISINIQGNTITIKASNNRATTYWLHCIIICYYNHTTHKMHSIKQQIVYQLWKRWALYTTCLYNLTSDKQFLIIIATRIDS